MRSIRRAGAGDGLRGGKGRTGALILALLAAGCSRFAAPPDDGGRPLIYDVDMDAAVELAGAACWRMEQGGWHYSIGHCQPMDAARRMTGVWVTGQDESSFFPGATAIPDPNDPRRFTHEIELDKAAVERLAGTTSPLPNVDAYFISFVGRRTRDPIGIDCRGAPYFVTVVDRLEGARRLGPMGRFRPEVLRAEAARPPAVTRRHAGRWGELEAEAAARCAAAGGEAE